MSVTRARAREIVICRKAFRGLQTAAAARRGLSRSVVHFWHLGLARTRLASSGASPYTLMARANCRRCSAHVTRWPHLWHLFQSVLVILSSPRDFESLADRNCC